MTNETRRRLFLVLLAAWLTGTLAVWITASNNFRHAKSVFDHAEQSGLAKKLAPLSAEDSREVMRHLASEINRSIFRFWDKLQVAVAVAALWLGWALTARWKRTALAAALVISLLLVCWITPTVLTLGPPLDFVLREPEPPTWPQFMLYHSLYLILDGVKMVAIAAVLVASVRERGLSPSI